MSLGRPSNDDPDDGAAPAPAEAGRGPIAAADVDLAYAADFLKRAMWRTSFCKDAHVLDDLAQEALVKLHRYLSRGGEVRNLDALLTTFAWRGLVNHLRRQRTRRKLFEDGAAGVESARATDLAPGDDPDALDMIEFATIEYFTTTGSPCLELARPYFDALDWDTVAAAMGLEGVTVRKRWSRCLETLRRQARIEGTALWRLDPRHGGH